MASHVIKNKVTVTAVTEKYFDVVHLCQIKNEKKIKLNQHYINLRLSNITIH